MTTQTLFYMTQITNEDIKKLAKLACIATDNKTCETLTAQVDSTINWIMQIQDANTDGVEPLTNIHQNNLRLVPDEISDGNIVDDILFNATDPKYNYFSVPKVIE